MKPQAEDNDTLIATLLFLLTRYTMDQDPVVGKAILEHLELLQSHPKTKQLSLLNTCDRLRKHWSGALSIKGGVKNRYSSPKAIDTNIHWFGSVLMCKTEVVVQRSLCSITVCRKCNVYVLHIGPMSFRLEQDVLDEVSEMLTDYSLIKKPAENVNPVLHQKH